MKKIPVAIKLYNLYAEINAHKTIEKAREDAAFVDTDEYVGGISAHIEIPENAITDEQIENFLFHIGGSLITQAILSVKIAATPKEQLYN